MYCRVAKKNYVVTAADRKRTERRTGSSKYPMENASQVRSAVNLRHHGKNYASSIVLNRASRAVSRLQRNHKITARTTKGIRAKIKRAKAKDKKRRRH